MKILVTGGAGYIGSHTTLALLQNGFDVVVIDNLCNSSLEAIERLIKICGKAPEFFEGDIRDSVFLADIFSSHDISAVFHFAGLKAVGESSERPLDYYDNNVSGTIKLCQAMAFANVHRLIFSSSATVYGDPDVVPISESTATGNLTNPYGRSKLMVEDFLRDLAQSDSRWSVALLRYFNPIGAHQSGEIGENPNGIPNNLLPFISQVAIGKLKELSIFGNDYATHDGTGVRDYIHILDLAEGHLRALEAIINLGGIHTWNLGTGHGYSVLEIVRAFELAADISIPYRFAPRRPGDISICYADPTKAERDLNWKARRGLDEMVRDAWRWQSKNPNGYKK